MNKNFSEEDFSILEKRMKDIKLRELFHEPCYLYEYEEDEEIMKTRYRF